MEFAFHPDLMVKVLPVVGTGMLGIFLVTGVIIGCVTLLSWLPGDSLTAS